MFDFLAHLFDVSDFSARWVCGVWSRGHGWLHIASDLAIFGAYLSIPLVLAVIAMRRRDFPFVPIFWLFCAFILACGTTHLTEAIIFWHPIYRFSGLVKLATALVSWATVLAIIPLVPRILTLRSPAALDREVEQKTQALREQVEHNAELMRIVELKNMELERSNKDLETFAYVASHDLQEPIRSISGYLELINRRYHGKLDTDTDEFIAFAVDGAKRMQMLLRGILAYSRIGSQDYELSLVELAEVIAEIQTMLEETISESTAEITLGELGPVRADRTQLKQLLQNLITNAIKFSGEAAPRIHISARMDESWCTVSVRDEGIGLDMKYAERISGMFKRLHGQDVQGTGIGLAIAERVVARHGGRIWVESEPGKGATFHFTLPAAVCESEKEPQSSCPTRAT